MSSSALALHQFRYDQRVFWRNPASVFFTVMFPVIFLLLFAGLFGNQQIDGARRQDLRPTTCRGSSPSRSSRRRSSASR